MAPYSVHPSYTFGGLEARRHRLREEQAWLDGPGYYAPDQALLAVELHVPAVPDAFERLRSDYLAEMHLKLMQHQLNQARACLTTRLFRLLSPLPGSSGRAAELSNVYAWSGNVHVWSCSQVPCTHARCLTAMIGLLQLLVAFAVAMTLNRTLIMPKMVCFCDRYWCVPSAFFPALAVLSPVLLDTCFLHASYMHASQMHDA